MARNYRAEYAARVERAKETGFSGYSEQRRAASLGYDRASEFGAVRQLAESLGQRIAPATVSVRSVGGQAYAAPSGIEVAGRDVGRDLGRTMADTIRAGNAGDRISIFSEGGTNLTSGRGFTDAYILQLLEDNDFDWDAVRGYLGYE